MEPNRKLKVALIGNPNCGKSTLFNLLTGLHQSTANFPGATVEKKTGLAKIGSVNVEFTDLPGAYSLYPKSLDEQIAVNVLKDSRDPDYPDVTLVVADASNLKRSLFLATQIIDLSHTLGHAPVPMIIALNMMDVVEKRGLEIDTAFLSSRLGVKIIPISARNNKGIDMLKQALVEEVKPPLSPLVKPESDSETGTEQHTIERYRVITELLKSGLRFRNRPEEEVFSSKTDRLLTHWFWGYAIFLLVLFLIFESVFVIAAYPMHWIESLFILFSGWSSAHLPQGMFSDLLVNGILSGISGIVVFIPQIALLFFFIALLEDSGYMARVSFIMDRIMRKFGLNGRSVIPLLSGVACAVPAIMGSRTISNWKERLITILVTPLISCSARLPVYTLLIALVIPSHKLFGFFNLQGIVLMGLYLIGFLAAIGAAFTMKYFIHSTERSYFVMELPSYRSPRWKNVGLVIVDRVKVFLVDAGKIIIAISIVLWALASHGPGDVFAEIEKKYENSGNRQTGQPAMAAEKLEASYAGMVGKFLEPAIRPLGFDWKVGIALVTSFAAREVFVGTMATIYSSAEEENIISVREKMAAETDPGTGKPRYTFAVGLSLMLFYVFAMQCMSTLAIVYRETRNIKWPILQFVFMGILAYLSSFIAYSVFQ